MSNWTEVMLSDICSLVTDGTHHSPPNVSTGDFKYITAKNIRPWGLDVTDITYVDAETHASIYARCPVEYGDILYIKDGVTTGIAAINTLHEPFSMLSSVALLKPIRNAIDPRFLKHWLNSPKAFRAMTKEMTGTAIKRLVLKQIRASKIELAPLPEQKRIADKLDSVLARVEACRERLDGIPTLLKRFRQSVLAAATSGRLTEDWRISTGAAPDAMYPRIKLSSVATSRLGKMLDKAKNTGTPTPYLRNVNVRWYSFDLTDVQMMRIEETERDDLLVMNGDVLICEGGEPGRCAIWKGEDGQVIFQKALHRVRPDPTRLLSDWLVHSLKYSAESRSLDDLFTGTTIKHLTGASLANFVVPLPPLPEQHEIVRRVETLFAFADRLEARCTAARKQVGQLTPALLAKAFRGELVPQDPNDEPAAELLKRLAASRGDAPRARRGRRSPAPDAA